MATTVEHPGFAEATDRAISRYTEEYGLEPASFPVLGQSRWQERGLLGALAVVMPEQHGVELFELVVEDDGRVPGDVAEAFLESLLLCGPDSITPQAITAVQRLLDSGECRGDAWELWGHLLRIACIPGHPLNADWFHEHLRSLDLADRDATWSQWLIGSIDDDHDSSVRRLLNWAWPEELDSRRPLPDNVASLATACWYNRNRLHSGLAYKSPQEVLNEWAQSQRAA